MLDRLRTPVAEKTGTKGEVEQMKPLLAKLEDIVRHMLTAAETKTLEKLDHRRDEIADYILNTIRNESRSSAAYTDLGASKPTRPALFSQW